LLASAHTPRRRNDLRQYLTSDGKLLAPLVYRDGQDGFAGVSGEVWTVEPGGHLSIAHFLNEKTSAPYWERDLTSDELKGLARSLAAKHLLTLPNHLGGDVKVNPHVLTLIFGKTQCELIAQAGEPMTTETKPPLDDPKARAERDFVSIVRALQALAKDRPQPGAPSP
jgi:hypothetical protein